MTGGEGWGGGVVLQGNDSMPLWKTTTQPELLSWNLFWRQFQYPARAVKDKRQINPALLRLHWSTLHFHGLAQLAFASTQTTMDTQVAAWKCAFAFKSAADGAGMKILRNTDRSLRFLRKGNFSCQRRTAGTTWSRSASPQSRKSDSCTRLTHVPRRSSLLLLHCQCSTPAATSSLIGSVKAVRATAPPDESPADPTARVTVTGLSCLEPYSCLSQAVLTRRAEFPSAPAQRVLLRSCKSD